MSTLDISLSEAKTVALYSDEYSEKYRKYDEVFAKTNDFQHYVKVFSDICGRFDKKINVLDIGCGSGRYFHLLKNVQHLTGIDVAAGMVKAAHHPVNEHLMDVEEMELIVGNIYTHDLSGRKYEFIYSIGVLGGHAPFTREMCRRIRSMLTPDGVFYVTVVDLDSRKNLKRKLAEAVYPVLPRSIKRKLDQRWKTNYMTERQLRNQLTDTGFRHVEIVKYATTDKGWRGIQMQATCTL